MHLGPVLAFALALPSAAVAQQPPPPQAPGAQQHVPGDTVTPPAQDEPPAQAQPPAERTKIGDLATVAFPKRWRFLPDKKGQDFLVQMKNPRDPSVLGVGVYGFNKMFVVFRYADEGHVKDDDYDGLDFAAMLRDMQANAGEGNAARQEEHLPTVELRGWAEQPHYDKTEKKLYFAKRLQFSNSEGETLNYCVRVLGRGGVLEINAVGGMEQLAEIAAASKELLAATEFVEGKRYQDFKPSYDKIAAYGIGGLIAGKLLLKAGLIAGLLKGLAVLWKPIALGVVAIGAWIARVFKRKPAPSAGQAGSGPQA